MQVAAQRSRIGTGCRQDAAGEGEEGTAPISAPRAISLSTLARVLVWTDEAAVTLLRWTRVPGVVAAFSSRLGGVSGGPYASLNLGLRSGDDLGRVTENRRRLCAAVGVEPARTSSCHQVHSAVVHDADDDPARAFDDPAVAAPNGDGLVTRTPERGIVAFGADCLPLVIARSDGTAVAVCHAGWRGLLEGIVATAAGTLGAGVRVAAIGPGAGRAAYEVGVEVADPLRDRFGPQAMNGRHADLAACAVIALAEAGIDTVDVAPHCTILEADRFYSHRRDGAPSGRQAVIAYLESRHGRP